MGATNGHVSMRRGSMTHARLASGIPILLVLVATTGWQGGLMAAGAGEPYVQVSAKPATGSSAPNQVSDSCALLTPVEAVTIMGTASQSPRTGAFAPTTCVIQSEKDPTTIYINTGFETDAILQTRGMDGALQTFDAMRNSVDDEEALKGVGDAAFLSKKINGLYILKGGAMMYFLLSPALAQSPTAVSALKKIASAIAARIK